MVLAMYMLQLLAMRLFYRALIYRSARSISWKSSRSNVETKVTPENHDCYGMNSICAHGGFTKLVLQNYLGFFFSLYQAGSSKTRLRTENSYRSESGRF